MRFVIITICAVVGRLVPLATAKPIPNRKGGGIAIPLTRHSSILNLNESIDRDTITSHGISTREKIINSLANYEVNTGTMHPFTVTRNESGLGRRGASLPVIHGQHALYWIGEISIGTPAKTLKVLIDTGSAEMWVLETGCCGVSADRDLWDPELSDSAKSEGSPFYIEYMDGTIVKGDQYSDNVTIAGFTADPQIFGSATSYTSTLKKQDAGGVLGLAFPQISQFGGSPLFESLVRQGQVTDPTFSFRLTSSGAEMYVGGANSMLYNGDITYTHVTVPGFWQVSMDDVSVHGNKILGNIPVIFDTGATYIFGDRNRVSELYRHIGGTLDEYNQDGIEFYYLPCDSFPTLGLTFGGRTFDIPPEVLRLTPTAQGSPNCFSAILGVHLSGGLLAHWTIGMTFLQSVYSVFDYGNLQVGFADLA